MAKVIYVSGVDVVSGALMKPAVRQGHSCGQYLVGTHRTAPTKSDACLRLYIKKADAYKRSTPPNADELAARARFTAVRAAVETRKNDLSKMTTDQQNFLAQKNQAGGEPTMNAYLWKICGQEYDTAHPQG